MERLRRTCLKGSVASLLLPWLGTGLLVPGQAMASPWNRQAFTAKNLNDALRAHGAQAAAETRDIIISAPEIAENGAKVDIEISCTLPNTRSLAIFAEKNPMPLNAVLEFAPSVLPFARLQLKLAETTRVRVVATTADGRHHVASREIKVTLGGCGA